MNSKKENPKKVTSFRLSDKHKELIRVSAYANGCSRTKVVEDALNNYYRIKR